MCVPRLSDHAFYSVCEFPGSFAYVLYNAFAFASVQTYAFYYIFAFPGLQILYVYVHIRLLLLCFVGTHAFLSILTYLFCCTFVHPGSQTFALHHKVAQTRVQHMCALRHPELRAHVATHLRYHESWPLYFTMHLRVQLSVATSAQAFGLKSFGSTHSRKPLCRLCIHSGGSLRPSVN